MPGITAYPYRIGSPQDKAQPAAGFCYKILDIRRHIIYNTVADLVFRIVADINNQVIIGKSSTGQGPEVDLLQFLCRPGQSVVHHLR